MSELHRELSRIEFEMRENSMTHTPVENEMRFYEAVKRGDMDAARSLSTPLGGEGFGVLSIDRLRNLKYHLVITVSFITRFCVEGGMERETAYNLSDLYTEEEDAAQAEAKQPEGGSEAGTAEEALKGNETDSAPEILHLRQWVIK